MYIWSNNRHGVSRKWALICYLSIAILFSYSHISAQQSRINYFYDDLGRLVRVVDENGNAATYHYDAVGNILRITRETSVPNTTSVTGLSSSSVDRGTTMTITISGFNFSCSSVSVATPGVTLSNVQISLDQIVVSVTISATAQVGSAPLQLDCDRGVITVPFSIIDTVPTVIITSPAEAAAVVEATDITLTALAADNVHVNRFAWTVNGVEFPPLFAPPYALTISIPFGTTSLAIEATATDNIGQTGTATRVIAVQPDPGPSVVITSPAEGATVIEGQQLALTANAVDNRQVVSVVWAINGVNQPPAFIFPYRFLMTVPTNTTSLPLQATATDDFGRTGTATRNVSVIRDPATTVVGQVVDINNLPVAGATVNVFDQFTAQSRADGTFSILEVPTVRGDITVVANVVVAGTLLQGISAVTPPVTGGTTNVSLIILKPIMKEPFYSGIMFSTGDKPGSVLVVDVNGDGKQDIVTANANSSDLSVLLSRGDGTFQSEQRFAAGDGFSRGPTSLVSGDVNGDGKIDLVTSNTFISDTVSVLPGNGDGTFQAQQQIAVGDAPNAAAVEDLNGDGKLDIVAANIGSGDISVLLGNGDGTFQAEQRFSAGDGPFLGPRSIAVADLNGDSRPDLVTSNTGSEDISVLLGNGDGTFQAQQRVMAGSPPGPVVAIDLNSDGKRDLIVAPASSGSNHIVVLLGNGDGTFQAGQSFLTGLFPSRVAVTDVNGDGKADVVTANFAAHDVSVLLGNGDGTFLPEARFAVGVNPSSVALANVNGDSHLDLVTTNESSDNVSVLFGNEDGTFQTRERVAVGTGPTAIIIADLNLDGKQDLVSVNNLSNDLSVLFGNGGVSFQPEQRVRVGIRPTAVAVADLDGDGITDLVVTNSNTNDVSVLLSHSSGTEQRLAVGAFPAAIAVADLNGDSILDLLTANTGSSDLSVLLGNGNGTFQTQLRYAAIDWANSIALGELNGDGKHDVVVTTEGELGNNVAVLVGNGDGSFQLPQVLEVGSGTRGVALVDVNGDLKLDIIASNMFSDDVSVLLGNGDGTFQPQQRFSLGDVNPRAVKVIDVDGDGKPDILTANDSGSVSLLLGNGDGTFLAPQRFVTGGLTRALAVADLNGDGKPDVATADNLRNQLSVLLHR
jgi:YD repeat-containing protein